MYKVPQVVALLSRGVVEIPSRICSEHEIPILEMIHTHGDIEIDDAATAALNGLTKEISSASEEYAILARRYGDDEKTGMSLVERIFGTEREFAKQLEPFLVADEPKKSRTKTKEAEPTE